MRHAILALTLLLASCSGESASFQPGQWAFKIEMSAEGKRSFCGGGGQCIDQRETADLPATILSNTSFGQCASSSSKLAGGKLAMTAACDGKSAATTMPASKVSLQGSFTLTGFESRLSAQLEGETPVKEMSGTLSAHRTGDCPAPNEGNAS